MKEDLKTILYMGLGVVSETNQKVKEISDELYKKGKELYEKGAIANEELKHKINDAMKENVTVVNVNTATTKEDILKSIENLSLEEQKELMESLKKGLVNEKHEERDGSKKS